MFCPYCSSSKSMVVDKRDTGENGAIRRRRECLECKNRFTTYEIVKTPLIVIKRNKSRENFNRDKIKNGIVQALKGRPVNEKKIEKLLQEIEMEIKGMNCMQVKSQIIGDIVTEKLKKLDKVAYVRFMSHFKDFKDVKTFKKALR
ncbi:MAG: transcriptional repressor NrdR [Candidatus Aenigmarchaeota archaeon]|nr:transcriptional repressor NrdR [Candidatus Aenigmarchaeota archaeon]